MRRSAPAVGGDALAGITGVKRSHMSVAARLGLVLKLVSRAERVGGSVSGAVTPMARQGRLPLGSTADVINYVEFEARAGRARLDGRTGRRGPAHLERHPR